MSDEEFKKYVKDCYQKFLNRGPEQEGLLNYVNLLKSGKIKLDELEEIFKNSEEGRLVSRIKPSISSKGNSSYNAWMKNDWDERAESDAKFFIHTVNNEKEKEFWETGKKDCEYILGINSPRYNLIINGKIPKEMRVLEIGCGIGRILIPMAVIFKEANGIDVSKKMIEISKNYIEKIPNCHTYETSGSDLSLFNDNYFDFCYSYIVFQHIPKKEIVENYIKEVSRVLKPSGIFRFQVRGDLVNGVIAEQNTWNGYTFSKEEIYNIAKENKFEVIEESEHNIYYWLTFKLK